jgi:hypothetical protein
MKVAAITATAISHGLWLGDFISGGGAEVRIPKSKIRKKELPKSNANM